MADEMILMEIIGHVGVIRLNRPETRNALNTAMMQEMAKALLQFEADPVIGAIVLTGDTSIFAAGIDVKEFSEKTYIQAFEEQLLEGDWLCISKTRKPVIAAVSGYALGAGCELALACDIVIASNNAKFGLPDLNLGIIPGIGGTQRLPRVVGKAKAMEMILTGRAIDAEEAERCGIVCRVVDSEELFDEALKLGERIASQPTPAVRLAKELVNRSYETPLSDGVLSERRAFQSLFATEDQKEGMAAFIEKRRPSFKDR